MNGYPRCAPPGSGAAVVRRACQLGALLLAVGCAVGSRDVPDGRTHRGDLSLAVGDITIGRGCQVTGGVRLDAGSLVVGAGSRIGGRIDVGSGNVTLGDSVQAREMHLANGKLRIGRGARIDGPVHLTNGWLEIDGAEVCGAIEIARGRLELHAGSWARDGLRIDDPGLTLQDSSLIVIRDGARVDGVIAALGRVRLIAEPGADLTGATINGVSPESRE